MKPACMDISEYAEWSALNVTAGGCATPCDDCTPEYCAAQQEAGTCLVWNGDAFVLGDLVRQRMSRAEYHRLWRAGLRPTRAEKERQRMKRVEKAAGLLAAGMSKKAIAREMGISRNTVYSLLRAAA